MKIVIEGAVIQNWLTKEVDRRVQGGGAGNADESISVRWIVLSNHPTMPFSIFGLVCVILYKSQVGVTLYLFVGLCHIAMPFSTFRNIIGLT